jgi:hypothetical protein
MFKLLQLQKIIFAAGLVSRMRATKMLHVTPLVAAQKLAQWLRKQSENWRIDGCRCSGN